MNPLVHTRTFRVRYYECDAYGHLNNTNYLRYMQETAFDASAAAGYGLDRYRQLGQVWLIRENEIEFLIPLRYGDSVEIKTWVADMQRVRSRRAYEFRLVGQNEILARGFTDWVYIDEATFKPTPIPSAVASAYFPDGLPDSRPERRRFPKLPPAPSGAFKMRRQVAWNDVDPRKHVNNAEYLAYLEDAGIEVSAAFGWPIVRYLEDGFGWFASKLRIQYLQAARLDDELEISTYLSNIKRASVLRNYIIRRTGDNELIAKAQAVWAFTNIETGRPARIPANLLEDFADNISDTSA